jgi:asparagine synthetase B (glutamine-hydrolysing)
MWHFVIRDPRDNTASVARDRFGVKPGFYAFDGKRLIVASEPMAILAIDAGRRRVDPAALREFLVRAAICGANGHSMKAFASCRPLIRASFTAAPASSSCGATGLPHRKTPPLKLVRTSEALAPSSAILSG